jgi:hypothetical protein
MDGYVMIVFILNEATATHDSSFFLEKKCAALFISGQHTPLDSCASRAFLE